MKFSDLQKQALETRKKYAQMEREKYGKEWSREQLVQGLVGDVGDLMKLVMAMEGVRDISDTKKKLAHELSDILWSVIVIAEKYEVDLETEFYKTMDELDKRFE